MVRDYRFYSERLLSSRLRYEVTSDLDYRVDEELSPRWRYRNTLLPPASNPRARDLVAEMRSVSPDDRDYVNAVLRMFNEQEFIYTLKPPTLGDEWIDEFVMDTRRGFCGHFAGSFVFMMRVADIPARVVVGYQGGEYNRIGDYVAVHQFDAHAWAEVWLPGLGWYRVDPTSAVAPERIESGLESALFGEDTFLADVGLTWLKYRQTLWLTEIRLQLSAIGHY